MIITSTTNPQIKELCLLKKNSERKKRNVFLVQGNDFIKPCIESGLAIKIFSVEENNYGIPLQLVSKEVLKKISLYENSLEPVILCSCFEKKSLIGEKLIYLDGVQDPGNVGTIIRTALAFKYDGVILSDSCASIYSNKVLSASKGAIFSLPVYESITLDFLKEKNYEIIVTALKDSMDFKSAKVNKPFVVVFGSEGQGVSKKSIDLADKIVKIEIDSIDSLNVAVAAGIILERFRE